MENGMILLTITTAFTSLAVEGIKKMLNIDSKKVSLNVIAAVTSVICSLLVAFGYIILADIVLTPKVFVYIIALSLLSFLSATVSYDKVVQTIKQINVNKLTE